ncbi:hypothetical protein F5Y06DRAFT_299250 [Hypoxylon sp. FL0890]|nr:hypothetical protein F5Y06DRAFT_299250 [Hypoxylon sp. FL0890]
MAAVWHHGLGKMRPCGPSLETLPPELSSLIWNAVGEEEDFSSLLTTSWTIRHEILRWMPGALLSCRCPFMRPCRCGKGFEIDRLTIIVDQVCSGRRWLKFYIHLGPQATPSVWCIADLDSPLARALRYCRPRETIVEFQAPERGHLAPAYMVLRAKLFDVCEILGWFQPQRNRLLQIRFTDPWPLRQDDLPFWEACMTIRPSKTLHTDLWHEMKMRMIMDPDLWPREKRPLLYESLLMPLILNSAWRNAKITFDRDPKRSTFSYLMKSHGARSEFFDHKLLSLTAWAYMDQLIHDGVEKLGDDDLTPYFQQYDVNARAWTVEKSRRRILQAAFHSSLLAMIDCSYFFDLLLERLSSNPLASTALHPLRAHICRTRNLSSANSFSRDHPEVEAAGWPWNLDHIRQVFVIWALEDAGKKPIDWKNSVNWTQEDLVRTRFLRWRNAHTPSWPRSWARNWPPLKKKNLILNPYMVWFVGFVDE